MVHTGPFLNWVQPATQMSHVCICVWESACMHIYVLPLNSLADRFQIQKEKRNQNLDKCKVLPVQKLLGLGK